MKKDILKTIIKTMAEQIQFLESCLKAKKDVDNWLNEEIDRLNQQVIDIQNREQQLKKMLDNKIHECNELRVEGLKKRAPLTKEQMSFVLDPSRYLSRRIEMIKYVRSCTGLGLKEAKEFVDAHIEDFMSFADRMGIAVSYNEEARESTFRRKNEEEFKNEEAGR